MKLSNFLKLVFRLSEISLFNLFLASCSLIYDNCCQIISLYAIFFKNFEIKIISPKTYVISGVKAKKSLPLEKNSQLNDILQTLTKLLLIQISFYNFK